MKKKKVYALCEAVADITEIATSEGFSVPDSRYRLSIYIEWAQEFQWLHRKVEWGVDSPCDYMEAIEYFTVFKMNCYRNYQPPHTAASYS